MSRTQLIKKPSTDTTLSQEQVEDYAGAVVASGGTKTGITVTYQDGTGDTDFVVDDSTKLPLAGGTMTGDIEMNGENILGVDRLYVGDRFVNDIIDDVKDILPWAECAMPLLGATGSGRYNALDKTGSISDSNRLEEVDPELNPVGKLKKQKEKTRKNNK